ncbi:MAG TPA: hypothetical protein DCL77_11190, partial [Prolixibacteraceae bacterium]|nr:hypothetical protein [Prolixibacteraceae bacterium]
QGAFDGFSSNKLELIKKNKREWNADLHNSGALERMTNAQDWNGLKRAEQLNSLEEERDLYCDN